MKVRRLVVSALFIMSACTRHSGISAPALVRVESGTFQWSIDTAPERVVRGDNVHFNVRAVASEPLYATHIEYGDGTEMATSGFHSAEGPQPCADQPASGGVSDDSEAWTHTYAKPGRYTLRVTFSSVCIPVEKGTATYSFTVR